jgi:TetR/AcrR family transcriptional regulator, transcriptional repressor of aconitase
VSRVPEAYLEARAAEIRDAALRVFVRRGVEGATMQEIAREAGVSAGAIYRYFTSKEALLGAVFEECGEQNRELFEESLASSGSPLAALMQAGRVVWDSFAEEGALAQFTVNVEGVLVASRTESDFSAQFRGLHQVIGAQITEMIGQAQAAGELDASIDAESLAMTLIACFEGTKLLFVEHRGAMPADAVYEVLARMLRALAPAG